MPPFAPPTLPGLARRGFTVVELMLAVVLVGVLVGVALPAYTSYKDKLKVKQAQDDISAMAASIDLRYTDTGTLPGSLADIGKGGLLDPWGRAYAYLPLNTPGNRGQARKDHSLVPLNSDYDLYSKGPDGASAGPLTAAASRDDILRANNGRFIGPASNY